MQNNEPQQSRFSVQFGEDIGSNEVSSVRVDVMLSKQDTNDKIQELRGRIITSDDLNLSKGGVFILPCNSSNVDALAACVERLFTDAECCAPAKSFSKAVEGGMLAYKVFKGQSEVQLYVGPGEGVAPMVDQQVQMASMMGAGQLVDNNRTKVSLIYKSLNDFNQLEDDYQKEISFVRSITKSLGVELDVSFNPSVVDQVLTLLATFKPNLNNSPIQLVRTFLSVGLDLKFKSSDELSDDVKKTMNGLNKIAKHGLALPSAVKEYERPFLREICNLIENGLEIVGFVEDLACVHVKGTIPGFAKHFTRNIQSEKEE